MRWSWTLLAAAAVAAALTGAVDAVGQEYGERAFKRALVTFAVARTLNGVISVAQGTEVAVEPGGVGVNFTVGQVLDPINDLVERFSSVMLVATTSLGLQNVLLRMVSWWGITAALVIAAAFTVILVWRAPGGRVRRRWVLNAFLAMAFVRFVVPLLIIGTGVVFDTFLEAEQAAATSALETTSQQIEAFNQQPPVAADADQSMLDRLATLVDDSLESMNVRERLESFKDRASNASEHIINLIVIFVLQTIILPLGFIWLLLELTKKLGSRLVNQD